MQSFYENLDAQSLIKEMVDTLIIKPLKRFEVYIYYYNIVKPNKFIIFILYRWWKDMNFDVIASYARNRVTELYVWVLALFLEPYYSHARIITSKVIVFLSLLDDTYDAYATIEEMRLITHAINRY